MNYNKMAPDVLMKHISEDGGALRFVKDQTPEICMGAVMENGYALQHVKNQTPELCLAAVQQNGYALVYVKNQTPEICLAAVMENILALRYVQPQYRTDELYIAAITSHSTNKHLMKYIVERNDTSDKVKTLATLYC